MYFLTLIYDNNIIQLVKTKKNKTMLINSNKYSIYKKIMLRKYTHNI